MTHFIFLARYPGQILDTVKCLCVPAPACSSFSTATACNGKFCPFNPTGAFRCFWSQGNQLW
jgi:hypothetical protein